MIAAAIAAITSCALATPRSDSFDLATTYQTMDYFGASDAWYAQTVGGWSDTAKSAIADLLFSPTTGIGLSCWRFNLGGGIDPTISIPQRTADTFETAQNVYDWTKAPNERWFLGAAKARGVPQYLAFVNSPTRRMTKNGHTYADTTVGTTNLKTGYEGQFAKYMVDVAKHFRDNPDVSQRVNFNYISPVNEPEWDWNGTTQEGNRYSVPDIKNVINSLNTELTNQQVNSQILVAEAGQIQDMYSGPGYVDAFAGDASVNTKLGNRLTYHSYWSDDPSTQLVQTRTALANKFAQYPGWRAGESEYSILGSDGPGRDLTMTTALNVARVIHYDLTVAGSTAWTWWLAMSAADWKDGLIYLDIPTQTYQTSKTLWALGNYSRFIRPGAKRVSFAGDNSNVNGLLASAYRNDTTGDFDIVYVNPKGTSQSVNVSTINATGFKSDYYTPYVTSSTPGDDLKAYPAILADDVYTVPAKSVVTLAAGTFNENNDGKVLAALTGSHNYTLGSGTVTFNPGAGTYSGILSGAGGITKSGAGTMVLNSANQYTGPTVVNGGILKINDPAALGTAAGGTTVNPGGTLDLNGLTPGNETITISGAGSTGQGALISTGPDVWDSGLRKIVLAGDATIGGTGRWNLRASAPGIFPVLSGNGHALTKVGANEIWFTNCILGNVTDININNGKLGFENVLGGMGDPGTVTIAPGATLAFYSTAATPVYEKQIVLNGATISNGAASTKLVGSLTTSSANTIDSGWETLTIDGPLSGSGSITKVGNGTLELPQPSDYTGAINISAGSILFGPSQKIATLCISANSSATMTEGNDSLLMLGSLTLSPSAKLDLNDNDLVVNTANFSTLQSLVLAGYSASPDNSKTGITSTTSQTTHAGTTILALFDNALAGFTEYPPGSGNSIATGAIAGKYTYIGDTNLDGQVTRQDYTAVDANLRTSIDPRIAWFYGDTNFDGNITPQDYTAIDSALGLGEGNPLAASGLAFIPEPSLTILASTALLLIRRRRQSSAPL
jgi:autotransporter-associated beta strand protein